MKTAFLIFGAQRSGTSVTSHILSEFGVNFGSDQHFIQGGHNPIFFELKWVNDANNQLIQTLGYRYSDFFLPIEQDFEDDRWLEPEENLQTKIAQEWGETATIGLKDPRFSLTFPLWQRVLSNAGYQLNIILAFRSPSSFLKSNQALFYNWEGWDVDRHLRFWLQLNLAATYFTRDLPVYFLCYEDLMNNPGKETEQLAQHFGLDSSLVDRAAAVVDRSHYHHQTTTETGVALIDEYYQRLRSRTVSADDYLSYRNTTLSLA
ncbi:sulfotransferase [Cyanobacteria bacterium FACHB-DQ100]|nr:sulfotransferase [Cyanobacteria bacterium FACHB-DQ100]